MEERVINLKFEKVQVIKEVEVEAPQPSYSYKHCSDTIAMILFISLILTIVTAGSVIMVLPFITMMAAGTIYILQMYKEPISYWRRKKMRKGR